MRALSALLAWAVLATVAQAQILTLGIGAGNGAPAPVISSDLGAVFNIYTGVGVDSAIGVTDGKVLTMSWWQFGTSDPTNDNDQEGSNFWGSISTHFEVTGGTAPGLGHSADTTGGRYQLNFNNSTGVTNSTDALKFQSTVGSNGAWHHHLVSFDTANGVSADYVDGANNGETASPLPANLVFNLNNSGGFHIQGVSTISAPSSAWMADVMIAQTSIVCTGAGAPFADCAGANIIPPSQLVKFVSAGKPVDIGSDCSKPFGAAPPLCFVGNGTAMGTNAGTAAATAIQAYTSTTYTRLFPAPYGPSGIPAHQATMAWAQFKRIATVTSLTMTTSAGSMPISTGDLIVIAAEISNSSGSTNYAMTCPSGFTQIGPVNDTFESVNSEVCYKILVGGDTSGAYAISWNTGGGVRTHGWAMLDYKNVASVDQTGSIYNGAGTTTNHKTAAGLSTTSNNETVVSAWVDWDAATNNPFTPPGATDATRVLIPDSGSPALIAVSDQYGVASATNPQKTMTSNTAVTSAGFTLTAVPN